MAASVNHTVRLPRCRSASLYSDQFVTRRFGRAMWWRRSALYLCGMKARSGASKQTGSLRHLSHPCNTLPLDHGDFKSVKLLSDPLCVIATQNHPINRLRSVRPEDVGEYPLVLGDM